MFFFSFFTRIERKNARFFTAIFQYRAHHEIPLDGLDASESCFAPGTV